MVFLVFRISDVSEMFYEGDIMGEDIIPAEASLDDSDEALVPQTMPVHRLVTPTRCICGETIPEGDNICPRDPRGVDLEREVDNFILKRM